MTIDEAIDNLRTAKNSGVKAVILAWWGADMFDRPDDETWAADAEKIEDKFDWAATHEDLLLSLETLAINDD